MKKRYSKICLLLVLTILAGILSIGCTKQQDADTGATTTAATTANGGATENTTQQESKPDISKPVELTMYLFGGGAPGVDAVYEKMNEMLKKDINATVKVSFIPDNDAYNLMLSSGEECDIINAANWLNYADNARKGAFMEITEEMLKTYMPDFLKEPDYIVRSGKVDGKIYALPNNALVYNYRVFVVRGDFMKKYNIPDIETLDDFGNYLDAVKKNEPGIVPMNMGKWDAWQLAAVNFGINDLMAPGAPNCTSPVYLDKKEDNLTLYNTLDNPEVVAFCKKMKEWGDKGYWSRDALSNPIGLEDSFKNGTSASMTLNYNSVDALYAQMTQDHPDWDVRFYCAFYRGYVDAYSAMGGGMSIGAKSRNPERALMLLNLLTYDREYYDLSQYGIKDVNYTLTEDGKIIFPPGNTYPYLQAAPNVDNPRLKRVLFGSRPDLEAKFLQDAMNRFKANPTVDFALDTTEISDIATNISNLYIQYGMPLYLGFVDDVDEAIATYKQKLDEAGFAKYKEVVKAQIEEYAKNFN